MMLRGTNSSSHLRTLPDAQIQSYVTWRWAFDGARSVVKMKITKLSLIVSMCYRYIYMHFNSIWVKRF